MPLAVVTGANRGIGYEYCRQLKDKGYEVVGLCRHASEELKSLGIQIIEEVDVTQPTSLQRAAQQLQGRSIDLLINNAGILKRETIDDMNWEQIRQQFEVNTLGPLQTTLSFSNLLGKGSKVAMMTSRMGSIADNTSGSRYGYRMSKAALNMASVSLAHDLRPRGIAVAILHPGYVQTGMTGHSGDVTAEQSVKQLIQRIEELTLDNSGSFWHAQGQVLPW